MSSYKKIFTDWFKSDFAQSDLVADMTKTVEGSPWHREDNVWVHTQMVVDEYLTRSPSSWMKEDFMGALVCAFHDTGKPMAEEVKTRDDGSTYRSYARHEIMSAGVFLNYIMSQKSDHPIRAALALDDIYNIHAMIGRHLPYSMNKKNTAILRHHMGYYGLVEVFIRCVLSDAYGRVSDTPSKDRERVETWAQNFRNHETVVRNADNSQTVVLLCGPSGSGKSSTILKHDLPDHGVHSMDILRLKLYNTDNYEQAFKHSQEDKKFNDKVANDFHQHLARHDLVFVDNTNLTRKRRGMYLAAAKRRRVEAIVFLNSLDVLHQRCKKRESQDPTKVIPRRVLTQQYYSFQVPLVGEVDSVTVVYNGGT